MTTPPNNKWINGRIFINKRPMDHIAHRNHLGKYLKRFFLYIYSGMHFIFFCDHTKQFHAMCKGGNCLRTPQACVCDLGMGISTVLEIIGDFLFKRMSMGPLRMVITTYHQMFPDTRNKNIYSVWMGSQWFSRYWNTSGLSGIWDHSVWSWSTYHQMHLDSRNNIYALWEGITTVYNTFELFQFKGTPLSCVVC
jgi:hypothetical protein